MNQRRINIAGAGLPRGGAACDKGAMKEICMPRQLALLAALALALVACRDGPVLMDRGLERGTALAPPGIEMPPPVGPDKR